MDRTLIVARIQPDSAEKVADIFRRSDDGTMAREIGVRERQLFRFHDLYFHIIDFDRPAAESMRIAQAIPEFRAVSEELQPYITAYDPNWKSPRDAMATRFYRWTA